MRITRPALLLLTLLTLPVLSPAWANAGDKHVRTSEYEEGHAYCPQRPMAMGHVVVPAGRCYTLAVLRNERGAFLAFMDPAVRLRSGGVERLTSWEGRRAWDRILFLVPIPSNTRIALIPVNTIQLIRLREEDEEDEDEDQPRVRRSTLIVAVPNVAVSNVAVTFVITF